MIPVEDLCHSSVIVMVGVRSPLPKSQSLARLHSPSQVMARKLVRKYSMGSNTHSVGQRKELTNLRTTLPHMKRASDLDLVLEAIKYIEQLQQKVVSMSKTKQEENEEITMVRQTGK